MDNELIEERTYTQDEVNELLQKEGDRRVTEALKKQEKKFKEAQQLALMSEQEKWEFQLKQREEAIAQKEKELALAEMKAQTTKILGEKGLSLDLVDLVIADDAETVNNRISALEKAFKDSVSNEITKRIGGNVPQKAEGETGLSREQFNQMTLQEQSQLAKTQPELYNALTKG